MMKEEEYDDEEKRKKNPNSIFKEQNSFHSFVLLFVLLPQLLA